MGRERGGRQTHRVRVREKERERGEGGDSKEVESLIQEMKDLSLISSKHWSVNASGMIIGNITLIYSLAKEHIESKTCHFIYIYF